MSDISEAEMDEARRCLVAESKRINHRCGSVVVAENAALKAEVKSLAGMVAASQSNILAAAEELAGIEGVFPLIDVLMDYHNHTKSTAQAHEARIRLDERGKVWREAVDFHMELHAGMKSVNVFHEMESRATQAESEATEGE